jgi:hypothetical protein
MDDNFSQTGVFFFGGTKKKLSIIGKKKVAKSCQQSVQCLQPHLVVSSFD